MSKNLPIVDSTRSKFATPRLPPCVTVANKFSLLNVLRDFLRMILLAKIQNTYSRQRIQLSFKALVAYLPIYLRIRYVSVTLPKRYSFFKILLAVEALMTLELLLNIQGHLDVVILAFVFSRDTTLLASLYVSLGERPILGFELIILVFGKFWITANRCPIST